MSGETTQVAVMTPPGTGAVGLIRVSGPESFTIIEQLLHQPLPPAGRLAYGKLTVNENDLDDVIVATGIQQHGPFVDLTTHGGKRVMERVLEVIVQAGAVLHAHPQYSETVTHDCFSIEGAILAALERARTKRSAQLIASQRRRIPKALGMPPYASRSDSELRTSLYEMADRFDSCRPLIEGIVVLIAGRPNAGKSTLLNRLCGRDAALVSDLEGTTRDWVEVQSDWDGLPISLIDTAGDRDTADQLEAQAIETIGRQVNRADVILWIHDITRPESDRNAELCQFHERFESVFRRTPIVVVNNKCDNSQGKHVVTSAEDTETQRLVD
ncbi:MAG: GTPase, partial [Phycisphaerae bacterium]